MASAPAPIPGRNEASALRSCVDFVLSSWKIILGTTLVVMALGVAYSLTQSKVYESVANVLFRETTISQQVSGVPVFENPQAPSSAGAEMITNVQLLQQDAIAQGVRDQLRLRQTILDLQHHVVVKQEGLGNLASITASASTPREAQRVAQAWAETFIAARKEADRRKIGDALAMLDTRFGQLSPAEQSGQQGRQIAMQQQKLRLLQSVQGGGAEIVQPASLPGDPVSPRPRRTLFLSVLLGIVLGVAIAVVRRALDRRIRDAGTVAELTDLPVIAQLPSSMFDGMASGPVQAGSWAEQEQFRTAAMNVRYLDIGHERRVIALTSARPQEGKTTTAANLAAVLARTGYSVSVIDCDLRRARMFEAFGVERSPGLTELVAGYADPEDAWRTISLGEPGNELRLLPSGMQPPNPLEMVTAERFKELVAAEKARSDYVIIDTPPLLVVSDAVPLAQVADAVLLIVRAGQTTRDDLRQTLQSLDQVGARPLGIILTGATERGKGYYGYGYYDAEPGSENGGPSIPGILPGSPKSRA